MKGLAETRGPPRSRSSFPQTLWGEVPVPAQVLSLQHCKCLDQEIHPQASGQQLRSLGIRKGSL